MKICLINNLFYPDVRGGAEQVVKNIADNMFDSGHDVVVITTKPLRSIDKNYSEKNSFKVYRFFPLNIFWIGDIARFNMLYRLFWHFFDIFNLYSFFKIYKILKKEKPDLVVTHNLKGIGYLTPIAIKKLKLKYIHTIHDVQLSIPSGLLISGKEKMFQNRFFLTRIYESINKKLFSYPDKVISPSKWLIDFYIKRGFFKKSEKVVIRNPITIYPSDKKIVTIDKIKFLYVGQLEHHKGVIFLLNVINKIKDKNFELIVVGGGSLSENVKSIADNNQRVKFFGRLSNEDVLDLYKKVDVTIVPSLCYENSPTVVYESLGLGTPVIVSDAGGGSENIEDGKNGYSFIAGDKDDLRKKILICLNDIERTRSMCSYSRESVSGMSASDYSKKLIK